MIDAANVAALTATAVPAANGSWAYVRTFRDFFYFVSDRGSLVVDGKTVVASAAGGTTAWLRLTGNSSPTWGVQATWFVNPATGNDENTGLASGTALQTLAELGRRLNPLTLNPAGGTVTIQFLGGNFAAADPLDLSPTLATGVSLILNGTETVVYTGAPSAVTAFNGATNQPLQVTDAGVTGGWAANLNRLIRITAAGANNNATAWIDADLGANVARWSNPALVTGTSALNKTIAGGETYTINTLTQLSLGRLNISCVASTSPATQQHVELNSLQFVSAGANDVDFLIDAECRIFANNTTFGGPVTMTGVGSSSAGTATSYQNAQCTNTGIGLLVNTRSRGNNTIIAGLFKTIFSQCVGPRCIFTFAPLISGGSGLSIAQGSTAETSSLGVGIINSTGNGVTMSPRAAMDIGQTAGAIVWGSGNTSAGMLLGAGAQVRYGANVPTIVGTAAEFACGTAAGVGLASLNPTVSPIVLTAVTAQTWANLAAVFNNNVINPTNNAQIVQ